MACIIRPAQTNGNLKAQIVTDSTGDGRSQKPQLDSETSRMRTLNPRFRSSLGQCDAPNYLMDVISQPPSNARLGEPLQTPVTTRLRLSRSAASYNCFEEGRLLAVATLAICGSDGADVPANPDALTGPRLFGSIYPAEENDLEDVGYASFPELAIMQEGTHKIRIALIRVTGGQAETTQIVETRPFSVGRS